MTAELLRHGATIGREFRVERRIATGGMGTVYECVQLSTGKRRALKVMHAQYEADARARERFIQEARAGASIDSDHIVEMVAAGIDEESNTPWIAMELLNGQDLKTVLSERGCLSPAQVREVFRQLCHGLAAAHRMGLVHRDLKPENIFLAVPRREGIEFTVKLLDFGIAKVVQEGSTSVSHTQAVGSPRWMAPEQAERGGKITPATDVWALGLIAFSLLTGKSYWKTANTAAPSVMQQMCEVLMDPFEAPSARAVAYGHPAPLPEGFDAWFARCVVRDPFERFPDAQEALDAFQGLFPEGGAATVPRALSSSPGRRSEMSVEAREGGSAPSSSAGVPKPRREIRLDAMIPRDEAPGLLDASLPPGTMPSLRAHDPRAARRSPALVVGVLTAALGLVATAVWVTTRPAPAPAASSTPQAPQRVAAAPSPPAAVMESAAGDSAVPTREDAHVALNAAPPTEASPPASALPAGTAPTGHTTAPRSARGTAADAVDNGAVLPPSLANAVARLADGGSAHAPAQSGTAPAAAAPPSGTGESEPFHARVMSMMRARQGDFVRCYETGTQGHEGVAGRLEVQFTVATSGRAENVRTRGLDAAPEVGTCVAEIVRGISFPPGDFGDNPLIHVMNFRREVAAPRPSPAPGAPTDPTGY